MLAQKYSSFLDSNDFLCLPIGGCGEFGMNCTLYQYASKSIIVDAGILFADPHLLGVDGLFPDISNVLAEVGKIEAYVITHGHEDHIGALPFFYKEHPAPIYATPWTALLLKKKVAYLNMEYLLDDIRLVQAGDTLDISPFSIEYIHVNHSIPMACALHIKAGNHSVFHSGDFKLDAQSELEPFANLNRIAELSQQGIDLALVDSTNASSQGSSGSEKSLIAEFSQILKSHSGRVFFTTFSSNFWRLNSIVQACAAGNRRLCVLSQGMKSTLDFGAEFDMLSLNSPVFIPQDEVDFLADDQVALLVSGCQGEWLSGLYRLAQNEFGGIKVKTSDLFVFSSRMIPGNEKSVLRMMNNLKKNGAEVISPFTHKNVHVSGHAYADEIQTLAKTLNAKNYVPIHGSFTHLKTHFDLIQSSNLSETTCHLIENNALLILKENKSIHHVPPPEAFNESLFLDSESRMPMSKVQLRERLKLGELGGIFCSLICQVGKKFFLKQVVWKSLGLPLDEATFKTYAQKVETSLAKSLNDKFLIAKSPLSEAELAEWLRIFVRKYFAKILNKKIVVIIALHVEDN